MFDAQPALLFRETPPVDRAEDGRYARGGHADFGRDLLESQTTSEAFPQKLGNAIEPLRAVHVDRSPRRGDEQLQNQTLNGQPR